MMMSVEPTSLPPMKKAGMGGARPRPRASLPLHLTAARVLVELVHRRAHPQLGEEARHRVAHRALARREDHRRLLRRQSRHPLRHRALARQSIELAI